MIVREITLAEFAAQLSSTIKKIGTIPAPLHSTIQIMVQADVREQFYGGHGPDGVAFAPLKYARPQGGTNPLTNFGVLANSYHATVDDKGVTLESTAVQAAIHQYGGVIRPVNAKALTIPLTKEAARVGSPRRFPRPLFSLWGGLVESIPSKAKGKPPKIVKHFLFCKSVTIPKRSVGFSNKLMEDVGEVVTDFWALAIAGNS